LKPRRETGYAMVVAVAGMMAFAYVSFEAVAVNRGATIAVAGQVERARLKAAADSGIAVALNELGNEDTKQRWWIGGKPKTLAIDNMVLQIVIQDERGKIPINRLDEDQVRTMFADAGAKGNSLDTLVDSFEDWQDEDDDARPNGAEAPYYQPFGLKPRNGPFRTIDEMSEIRGMDRDMFAKLKPSLTVFFGDAGGFSVPTSQPLALAVMSGVGPDEGQPTGLPQDTDTDTPAFDPAAESYIGRPLTVQVTVRDPDGGIFSRAAIVELTGSKTSPYWIRYIE
jgi:general secretion pathway protein K